MTTRNSHCVPKLQKIWNRLRTSRASRTAAASYLAFFSTALWGLVTIPVAISFLNKEELGLWTVINAFLGYLIWMDLGVGGATGRMLADSVAKSDRDEINRWWTATRVVLICQGCVVAIIGLLLAPALILLLDVPPALEAEARWVLSYGAIITGLSFPMRGAPGLLMAQERFYWVPLVQAVTPWLNLIVFYLLLRAGWGLKAYVWALAASQAATWITYYLLIRFADDRPRFDRAGLERRRFGKLFAFSGNLTVIGLVDTMMLTLPALMIARLGSLSAVPIYNFSWKGPLLASGLVARTYQSFYPGLQRLYVSGERELFRHKHEQVGKITVGVSLIAAAGILGCNTSLVHLLTGGGFYIGAYGNLWFALAMVTVPISGYFRILMPISGNLGKNALVSVCKLPVALGLGVLLWGNYGLSGIAASFALAPLLNGVYGYFRGTANCGFTRHKISSKIALQSIASAALIMIIGTLIANLPVTAPSMTFLEGRLLIPSWQNLALASLPFAAGFISCWKGLLGFRIPTPT
jgi:O-antigen/teichoic acid export membrane protein